jgi:hypothetical protein
MTDPLPTPGEQLAAKLRANIENPALRLLPGGAGVRAAMEAAAAYVSATEGRIEKLERQVAGLGAPNLYPSGLR